MKVALIGSRSYADYEEFKKFLKSENITHIISGGANGADYLAECYAHETGLPITVYLADWEKYGKSAGYKRNIQIVEDAEKIIAFWDGNSKGTKHSIDLATKAGKLVRIIHFDKILKVVDGKLKAIYFYDTEDKKE